jgi:hypothetical protein
MTIAINHQGCGIMRRRGADGSFDSLDGGAGGGALLLEELIGATSKGFVR